MKELECPHCETMNSVPDDCYETNTHFEKECSECKKVFGFTVEYSPVYTSYKVPCANGEPHKYKQIVGAPRHYFIGKLRCEYCGDEKQENKVTCENGVYYLDGYPFRKLEPSFEINKEHFVAEYNDYPNGTFNIYKHLGITYIEGKTLSGDIKLEAEHPNVWFDKMLST